MILGFQPPPQGSTDEEKQQAEAAREAIRAKKFRVGGMAEWFLKDMLEDGAGEHASQEKIDRCVVQAVRIALALEAAMDSEFPSV